MLAPTGRTTRTSRRTGSPHGPERPEPGVYPFVDFRPDALDQALGYRVVVAGTEIGVRGHGGADLRLVVAAHERTLQPAGDRHKYAGTVATTS
ncbi:MAG: hypothetical protein ACRDOE_14250 [Streptosporangiaceae bacterium]